MILFPFVGKLYKVVRAQPALFLVFALLAVNWIWAYATGYSMLGRTLAFFLTISLIALLVKAVAAPLTRRVVWKVRNRLLLTYFLAGVMPTFLLLFMGAISASVILGAAMSYICRSEINHHLDRLERTAQQRAKSLDGSRIVAEGPISEIPTWSKPGFKGIVRDNQPAYFLVAHAASGAGASHAEVFVSEPFDDASLAKLVSGFGGALFVGVDDNDRRGNAPAAFLDSTRVVPAAKAQGIWDLAATGVVPLQLRILESGETRTYIISLFSRPTVVITRLFGGFGETLGSFAFMMLRTLGGTFLIVIVIAIVASAQLTRSLTRAIYDLHAGTGKIQSGDFSHRIPIRTEDQLRDLAGSFNIMTHRIERLISEVREKEKLEAELEIARQVQAQLFPRSVPLLKSLQVHGVCNPGSVVSGDYYDFVPLDSGVIALALGDISGKGISAALLLASIQSSLRAWLTVENTGPLSSATLVTRLNRQLYENTSPEKYSTFFLALYDDRNGSLVYTNAGHLPPVLIRDRKAIRLEATGTVVGIFAHSHYEQVSLNLEPNDLLAVFTDGMTECEDKNSEQFGEERLVELLIQNSDKPLDEISRIATERVLTWAHDPGNQDDTTLMLARRV